MNFLNRWATRLLLLAGAVMAPWGVILWAAAKHPGDHPLFVTVLGAAFLAVGLRNAGRFARPAAQAQAGAALARPNRHLPPGAKVEFTPTPFDVLIRYKDAKGAASDRVVTVRRLVAIAGEGGMVQIDRIVGRCHTRKAERTFLLKRIEGMADPETGEVIDDWRDHLVMRAGQTGT